MISIIVPIYNGEKYIPRLFNCFRRQTSQEFEVILVDDGSKDCSQSVAHSEASRCDFTCKIIDQSNAGVSRARNTGLNNASGDYVMFVDVDDLITDDRVEHLYNLAKKTESDIVLSGSKTVMDYNIDVDAIAPIQHQNDDVSIYSSIEILNAFLSESIHPGACGGILKREMIETNALRFLEGCKYSEDLHFMWRAFACCKTVCVSKKLTYLYMWVPNSAMSKFNPERLRGYQEIKALDQFMEKRAPTFAPLYKKYAAARILWSIARQASCLLSYSEFKQFLGKIDTRSEMRALVSYNNNLVRLSALAYLVHPYIFYVLARTEGRKRIHQ